MNLNRANIYLLILLVAVIVIDSSCAGKNDKKNKPPPQNKPNQSHKNSTISHGHKNHTTSHTNHANHTAVDQNSMFINNEQQQQHPSNVGWSLDKNQAQTHHNNPNGYVMQSHDNSHGTMNSPQQNMNVPVQQNQQGSNVGGIALGAVGGLASGAVGGYLLSNALNSGGKSGEKVAETTVVEAANETITSSAAPVTEILEAVTSVQSENDTIASTVEVEAHSTVDSTTAVPSTTQNVSDLHNASSSMQLSTYFFTCLFVLIQFIAILPF